jgi:hypothetical protein
MRYAAWILSVTAFFLLNAKGLADDGSRPSTRFLVFVRDELTEALLPNAAVSVSEGHENGVSTVMSGETCVVAALLGEGTYDIIASALGYDSLVYKSIYVPEGEKGELWIPGLAQLESFSGRTVTIGAKLHRCTDSRPAKRTVSLISDSEYYWQTDAPPFPIGGTDAIMKKIDISRVGSESAWSGGVKVAVLLGADGVPDGCREIEETHESRRLTADELSKLREILLPAIVDTRFSPARILGKNVRSYVFVPFEISWKGRKR